MFGIPDAKERHHMRKYLGLVTVLALPACGGGGGGGAMAAVPGSTVPPSGTGTSSNYVTPTFKITIPPRSGSAIAKSPAFVSSGTQSVTITLTADSIGVNPTTLVGNPATTTVSGTTCGTGCTVNGPPSPVGSDSYTITTFDTSAHALNTNSGTYTIAEGVNNAETITLNGIPASIAINGLPATNAFTAGSSNVATMTVTVADADGETITGTYQNAVTVTDPDTNSDGSSVTTGTCRTSTTPSATVTQTSATFTSSTSSANFCYLGLGENPLTLTSSAAGVSGGSAGTAAFQPQLSAPAFVAGSGTPASIVVGSAPPDVQLNATSGTGSTGSANYIELGWTNAPYNQTLIAAAGTCSIGGPFSTYATIGRASVTPGTTTGATQFTMTAIGSPAAGACPTTIGDGLSANSTDVNATLDSSYTISSFSIDGHARQSH
jgi:hypothetical protein